MDTRPYYYRVRGRTLGPVTIRQMRQLAQRAQIGRATDVSRDGAQWGKAADHPEIFESPAVDLPAAGMAYGSAMPSNPAPVALQGSAANWYYAKDGIQNGPVDLGTLQRLVASGQLTGSDHVFVEGSADWMMVSSVPQLAMSAGAATGMPSQGGMPVINVNVPRQTVAQPDANGLAIAGFVLSLLGCWPIGLILCLVALNQKNRANRGLAIAGAIIGGILALCSCGYVILVFMAAVAQAGW